MAFLRSAEASEASAVLAFTEYRRKRPLSEPAPVAGARFERTVAQRLWKSRQTVGFPGKLTQRARNKATGQASFFKSHRFLAQASVRKPMSPLAAIAVVGRTGSHRRRTSYLHSRLLSVSASALFTNSARKVRRFSLRVLACRNRVASLASCAYVHTTQRC